MKKVIYIILAIIFIPILIGLVYVSSLSEEELNRIEQENINKKYTEFIQDSTKICTENIFYTYEIIDKFFEENLKDPKSLEYISKNIVYNKHRKVYCADIKYRAKNGFNGYTVSRILFDIKVEGNFNQGNPIYYSSIEQVQILK